MNRAYYTETLAGAMASIWIRSAHGRDHRTPGVAVNLDMAWHAIRLHQVARTRRVLYGFTVWRCQCGKVWFR